MLAPTTLLRLLAVFLGLTFSTSQAGAFKFSEEEEKTKGDDQARAQRLISQLVSAPASSN
ncbi:MAG: hypothetical protein IPG33_17460 [Betaproteobacteria bacterium]|nr:hypothetical protein [Betaproteobacteria bacterium]